MLRVPPVLLAALMLSQPAQADVMYSWQQIDASSSMPTGLNLELVFSDAAVAQGALSLDIRNMLGQPDPDPQDSLLSLRYWFDAPGGVDKDNLIDYGYRDAPRYFGDHIVLDVRFLGGGLLGGSIFANDGNSDFLMESTGAVFSMIAAHSDEFFGCGDAYPNCEGGSGLLRAVPDANQVPEPTSAAIAGLGLAAAWFARRRKPQA